MNKLWVFGDANSSIFNRTTERRFFHYKEFRNGELPESWSEILSKKLKLKLQNYAVKGQSNYDIFEWFCKYSDEINEGDVVIIGWSEVIRFRLYDQYTNDYETVRPNALKVTNKLKFLDGIQLETINEILKNRENGKWFDEIYSWENLINSYSKIKKFKIFYWTFDSKLNKNYYIGGNNVDFYDYLKSIGSKSIEDETYGKLKDSHLGEIGQLIQSEYFYNFIKQTYE